MNEKYRYLDDTWLFEADTTIAEIGCDERGSFVILGQTVFHPQGGGQPSDVGIMTKGDGSRLTIIKALFIENDIRHYVDDDMSSLAVGDTVSIKIDEEIRTNNAKCHTAGHILQAVVEAGPYGLKAFKGFHYADGSYVEFAGDGLEDKDAFVGEINDALASVIRDGRTITTSMVTSDELKSMGNEFPDGFPQEKPLRVSMIEGFQDSVPCGGTHLASTNGLTRVGVRKVKSKKDSVRVSYTFE